MRMRNINAIIAALLLGASGAVSAEADKVLFAQQFGLLYLPMHVVVDQQLVESCAKAAGLGEVEVSMHRFSGGAAVNQALLSGNVDFAAGGIGPLLTIWDKTRGKLNVRGDDQPRRDAVEAQHERPGREHARGLPESRGPQDRDTVGEGVDPGPGAADGGGEAVGAGQLRQARRHDGVDEASLGGRGPCSRAAKR